MAHASFENKKQRLALRQWHDTFRHIDPAAIKHLEKYEPIDVTDTTVASEMCCRVSKKGVPGSARHGGGGRTPEAPGEVVHTDLEGRSAPMSWA